jgi:hypothetical protein
MLAALRIAGRAKNLSLVLLLSNSRSILNNQKKTTQIGSQIFKPIAATGD